MVRTSYGAGAIMRNKENDDENDREECADLHLQLHQRRLPVPALHLQELQLLTMKGAALAGAAPFSPAGVGLSLSASYDATTTGEETMAKGQMRSNKEARKPKKAKVKTNAANLTQKGGG